MKIIVEKNIPYISGLLEKHAEVLYLPYQEITSEAVKDADVLLVRTRTRCDEALLEGSRCRFIGTATIGMDHIDVEYCNKKGIKVTNAPGCNAPAVAQYVLSAIGNWMKKEYLFSPEGLTIGVVGVGHVGSIVAEWARNLGFKVLLNDPPLQRAMSSADYVPLSKILHDADIVTIHTPLTHKGIDATYHLANRQFILGLEKCQLLINCARGEVLDTDAVVELKNESTLKDVVIDCWEGEPHLNTNLLEMAYIATPHIAGYSLEGKQRATYMLVEALATHFGWDVELPKVEAPLRGATEESLDKIMQSYNPLSDTKALKAYLNNQEELPEAFEALRNTYDYRKEVAISE